MTQVFTSVEYGNLKILRIVRTAGVCWFRSTTCLLSYLSRPRNVFWNFVCFVYVWLEFWKTWKLWESWDMEWKMEVKLTIPILFTFMTSRRGYYSENERHEPIEATHYTSKLNISTFVVCLFCSTLYICLYTALKREKKTKGKTGLEKKRTSSDARSWSGKRNPEVILCGL